MPIKYSNIDIIVERYIINVLTINRNKKYLNNYVKYLNIKY